MPAAVKAAMGPREWGMLIALAVVWGGSFFFIGIAIRELPPLTIVAVRLALAAFALHGVLRITGERLPRGRAAWRALFAIGLLNNAVPFTLMAWSQSHIASGLASILNAAAPLFSVLAAHLFLRDERLTSGRLAGVLVGFAGVAVLIGTGVLASFGIDAAAQLASLAAALCYALSGVFGRRFSAMGIAPVATATGQITASAAIMLPLALAVDRPWMLAAPSGGAIASVLCLALLSTAFAYILFFRILASAGATNVTLVTFLVPVSAIFLGLAFLGERLEPRHLMGMALIGVGLALIDGRAAGAVRSRLVGSRPASRSD